MRPTGFVDSSDSRAQERAHTSDRFMLGACDPRIANITWETESYPIEVKVAVVPPYKWQILALNIKIKDKPIVSLGKGPPVFHQKARWRTRHQFNPIDRPLLTGRF